MTYRQGNINDIAGLKNLALKSWTPFKTELTTENWQSLFASINSDKTYIELVANSQCIVCENNRTEIIRMAFLVPQGNPTNIYDEKWCYIRFVSVHPEFAGQGIGRLLTEKCIQMAINNKEQTIALHTSEMMGSAIHIYESLGFKILREIDQRLGKRYWLYTLDIASPN
ncbi:MAG: GNAT family N-acetyltransferase [Flavobacteriales bacterium]|nr:GNAT family N-acetyltransferase [Flavobacteriales bacterium]